MIPFFPHILSDKIYKTYLVALLIVTAVFNSAAMPLIFLLLGIISVIAFCAYSQRLTLRWASLSFSGYEKKLLLYAFLIRAIYCVFVLIFNNARYGSYMDSNAADIGWYVESGMDGAGMLADFKFNLISTWRSWGVGLSDMGYCLYLSVLYFITGSVSEAFVPLMVKSLLGAYTCVFISRIADRHFGESVAKMTGIFCMLQFNLIWWCGSMMKETEMTFFLIWMIAVADKLLMKKGAAKKVWNWLLVGLLWIFVFMFRSSLAVVAFLALAGTAVLSSNKIVGSVKKVMAVIIVALLVAVAFGNAAMEEVDALNVQLDDAGFQQRNLAARAESEGGNSMASLASKAIFAPLIFTLPFPTMVYTQQDQEMLMMVNGGNFLKNILSFFVILVMFKLLLSGRWRDHLLPICMLCGYLMALVLSQYSQSGRFHIPILPFEMMFAAYGISLVNRNTVRWFNIALVVEVVACVGWSWFKLAGRGMV